MHSKNFLIFLLILSFSAISVFAQDSFVRKAVIDVPEIENGGFGNIVAGVDLDGDGKMEIYAVNDNWGDSGQELIPSVYKYEDNNGSWDMVWSATLGISYQNTWPALASADLDNDGKGEIVWGPVNNFGEGNEDPPRLVVFEANGDDVLGVSDGSGGYLPNSSWNMDVPPSTNMRPIRWNVTDIDSDGTDEIVFADRGGYYYMGVVSVDDIPDNGGGSETWTVEFSGKEVVENAFVRTGVIAGPDGSFGNAVSGMDFDADGYIDLYAVNDNWGDGDGGELIPTLFKYEFVSGAWVLRWSTTIPGVDLQNTWPALTFGDWDNDGKGDIQWTPINNGPSDYPRLVVYETPGDGSDVMGVDQGDGTYAPNASWNMGVEPGVSMRPFKGHLVDIDNDGADEFVFVERHNVYTWGIVGVDNIPDNGDGSETFTMEASGEPVDANHYRDLAIIGNTLYVFDDAGTIRPITYDGTTATEGTTITAGPSWAWQSAQGVDLDNDGSMEIVVGDYSSSGSSSVWVLVPDGSGGLNAHAVADFSTYPATQITNVKVGDIDGNDMADFVVGFRGTDAVYRVAHNGGDITSADSYSISLLDQGVLGAPDIGQIDLITLADVDGDGDHEVMYGGVPRSVPENTQPLTVGDFGNFTLEGGSSQWDIAIANGTVYTSSLGGDVNSVYYDETAAKYMYGSTQPGLLAEGTFKSMTSGDADGDGVDELFSATYNGNAAAYMYKMVNGGLQAFKIADLAALGGDRLTGGAAGDIDGDGMLDLVFGTRASVPNNSVYRVEYRGGDVTDMANWQADVIDYGLAETGGQLDIIKLANVDADADLEIVYSGIPRSGEVVPIVILDLQAVQSTPIADVKVDADGDNQPDNIGATFTVSGVVTSINFTASSNRFSYYIQDDSGAINVTKGSEEGGGPVYELGTILQVTGVVGQYRGLTQLEIADVGTDVIALGTGTVPDPAQTSIADLLAHAEMYEGMLVKFPIVVKAEGSEDWPAADASANMTINDGTGDLTLRIDNDTDIDGQEEPAYPMSVVGVITQYTSSSSVYDDGYQISPSFYSDFTGGVPAPPSPYFYATAETKSMYDGQTISINSHDDSFTFAWEDAIDLNGDNLIYQLVMFVEGSATNLYESSVLYEPTATLSGSDIIDALGNTSMTVMITMRTKGTEAALVVSVDTLTTTFDIVVGVEEESMIPKEFYVDQNYPNPFNPATTISFGLPEAADVNLVIYDILGREVTSLIRNESMNAGIHHVNFNASSLASGTYVYRLSAGKKVEIKKMLLLK